MGKISAIFILTICLSCSYNGKNTNVATSEATQVSALKSGDIVFQNAQSRQCKAIELATHSKYTHCGIVFLKNSKAYVLEAVQPVRYTLLGDWVARGLNEQYAVKRLKDQSILSDSILTTMQQDGEKYLGKDYDIYFGWGDDKIYCSELVWKVYKESTGLDVGALHQLKDFDLSSEEVKRIMNERYGNNIPLEEKVISPSNIFDSELLETISE